MNIRKATIKDRAAIMRTLHRKQIPFATAENAKNDIELDQMFVLEDANKILAICSMVYDKKYNYHAIKRLVILNNKNKGKGYASILVSYLANLNLPVIGCTPWSDNLAMKKLLQKLGFIYQYTFSEYWEFFLKIHNK